MTIPVAILASHDITRKKQDTIDHEIRASAEGYRKRGTMESHKFQRSRDGDPDAQALGIFDENKFGLRISPEHRISSVDILAARALQYDTVVGVIGSPTIGLQMQQIKEVAKKTNTSIDDRLFFKEEAAEPRLDRTIKYAHELLGRPEKMVVIAADIPKAELALFFQTYNHFNEKRFAAQLDLNARESVFANIEPFFTRNYYNLAVRLGRWTSLKYSIKALFSSWDNPADSSPPEIHSGFHFYKECNAAIFGKHLINSPILEPCLEFIYNNRQAGGLANIKNIYQLAKVAANARGISVAGMLSNHRLPQFLYDTLLTIHLNKKYRRLTDTKFVHSEGFMRHTLANIIGHPIKILLDHQDPMKVLDDDAWEDHGCYWELYGSVAGSTPYNGLDRIMESGAAKLLHELDTYRSQRDPKELPMIMNFLEYAQIRAEKLDIADFFPHGEFKIVARKDANIPRMREYLEKRHQYD